MANIIKTTLEDANDVLTYSDKASFPSSGESGKLYIAADTKYTYFWNGSSYIETRGSGYASSSHTHDDRYYTESEVNNKLKYLHPTIISNGAIDTHPESTDGGTLIGYYTNDLVNLSERGGSCYIKNLTQNTIVSESTPNELFDGSPSYYVLSAAQNDIIEITIKSPTVYNWTTRGGIGFGNAQWGAKSIKIEVGYSKTNTGSASSPDSNIVWITKFNETNNWDQLIYTNLTGPNSNEGGTNSNSWSYLRITLTNFRHTNIRRIAQIFTFNYSSTGMHQTFLPKAGGYILGNIAPYKNNSYWLGGDNNKWAGIHAVNIYQNGNKVIDTSNLKAGNNIRITNSNGTVTIDAANTTYSAGTGLSLSGNTFSVKTGYTTDANNRNYKVAADNNGNLYVNVPWSVNGTLDTSLNSSSTNALQNKAIYSAFSSAVGYDNNYYAYGEKGSWRMCQYNATGNSLDIRYGIIAINSQSANYSVSFSKNFTSTNYTVVFGLYRSNAQSWFWSPIVQSKTTSGFTVFLRGNSGGDNGGTIMYLAIRSN